VTPFESRIREARARERAGYLERLWRALEDRADATFMLKIGFVPDDDPAIAAANGGEEAGAPPSAASTAALAAVRAELAAAGELDDDDDQAGVIDFAAMVDDATIDDDLVEVKLPTKLSAAEEWRRHVAAVHLWFRLRELANNAYEAELVSRPFGRDDLQQGDVGWYRRDQLSDWHVLVDGTRLDPTDLLAIRALLAQLESGD
jgi:hypothetical protein